MIETFKKILLPVMLLTMAACAHLDAIENIGNAPIPMGTHKLSQDQVSKIIAHAALARGWSVSQTGPALLHAKLNGRQGSEQEVDIAYTTSTYSITYASSQNLEASNGQISSTYNRYIDYLNMSISKALNDAVF